MEKYSSNSSWNKTKQQQQQREYNILSWLHNLFLVFLFPYVLQCTENHFSWLHFLWLLLHCAGAASLTTTVPQRGFKDDASIWYRNDCINSKHNSHEAGKPNPQTMHISDISILCSRVAENRRQRKNRPFRKKKKGKKRCSAWNVLRKLQYKTC